MTLHNYINERIEKARLNSLYETTREIVAEALLEDEKSKENGKSKKKGKYNTDDLVKKLMSNDEFKKKAIQYLTDEDAFDGWSDALDGKTYDTLDNLSDGSKRRSVTQRLKDKKIDYAPLAYELWPGMSKDAARSWFSKKVDGKNESFNDEEISQLYSLLTNIL